MVREKEKEEEAMDMIKYKKYKIYSNIEKRRIGLNYKSNVPRKI